MPVTIAVCSSALMSTLQTPGDKQWKLVNLHLQPAHVQLETKQGNRIQKVLLLYFLLFFPRSLTPFLLPQTFYCISTLFLFPLDLLLHK